MYHYIMKKSLLFASLLLCVALVHAQSTKKVLLIGIDGCRPDALQVANTPNLDALRDNGTYTYDAMNDGITISGPGWASLLTGVWPDKHGITDNTFLGFDVINYPHLFKRIEEYNSDLNTVSICQWSPINLFLSPFSVDQTFNVSDHSTYVEDEAVIQLTNADPDAIFLHFDDVDHAGHNSGFSPTNAEYLTSIETVDASIGGILTALYARPNYANEDWAIIVSTDHGGVGTSHGGTSFEHRNVFLFISGDNIPNEQIVAPSSVVATPPVTNCLADSVQLYFDGNSSVTAATNLAFDFGATQDFTVECRVRTNTAADVAIATNKDWDSGFNPGWVFSFGGSGSPWKVNVGDGLSRVDVDGNNIDDNEWHTLSATFDRDGDLTIYEDGVQVGSSSLGSIDNITSGYPISFGKDGDGEYAYEGYISEVRVFNSLVSDADIDTWKCTQLTNTHTNYSDLIGYWRLADGSNASTVADSSPTQADGTVSNAQWQNAQDTIFSTVFDYSNTPKQVDYVVSALEHLCIPIDPSWNLDGQIVATNCTRSPSGITDSNNTNVVAYLDNTSNQLVINTKTNGVVSILDMSGRTVLQQTAFTVGRTNLDLSNLNKGVYLYHINLETGELQTGKVALIK